MKFDDIDPEAEVSAPAVVVFEYGAFLVKCADGTFYTTEDDELVLLGRIHSHLYEVIGNIHENPELLEKEE